jgi:DNA-directed RNA polymerase subunit RPC12/RpoP
MKLEDFVCPHCSKKATIYEVYTDTTAYATVTFVNGSEIRTGELDLFWAVDPEYICSACGNTIAFSPEELMAMFDEEEDHED